MMTVTGLVGGSLMSKSSLLDHISLMDYLTGGGGLSWWMDWIRYLGCNSACISSLTLPVAVRLRLSWMVAAGFCLLERICT